MTKNNQLLKIMESKIQKIDEDNIRNLIAMVPVVEKALLRYDSDIIIYATEGQFMHKFIRLMQDHSVSYTDKQAAAVLTNRVIEKYGHQFDFGNMVDYIWQFSTNWIIPPQLKFQLQNGFVHLINHWLVHLDEIFFQLIEGISQLLIKVENQSQEEKERRQLVTKTFSINNNCQQYSVFMSCLHDCNNISMSICMLMRCVLSANLKKNKNERLKRLVNVYANIFKHYFRVFFELANDKMANELFLLWDIIYESITKLETKYYQTDRPLIVNLISNDAEILMIIKRLYKIGCSQDQENGINYIDFIYPNKIKPMFDHNIVKLKIMVSEFHFQIVKLNLNPYDLSLMRTSLLINEFPYFFQSIIKTLLSYNQQPNQDCIYHEAKTFLVNLIKLLIIAVPILSQSNLFYFISHKIIFPFIKINQKQRSLFQINPEEFLYLNEDCCDSQSYRTLKSESCKLLEEMADFSNQFYDDLIQLIMTSLKTFAQNFNNQSLQHINSFNGEYLSIQTSFLILSLLAYKNSCNQRLIQFLHSIFCGKFVYCLSEIELSRVYLFLSYCFEDIFESNRSSGFFLIQFALNFRQSQGVNLFFCQFLSNICTKQAFTCQMYKQFLEQALIHPNFNVKWMTIQKLIATNIDDYTDKQLKQLVLIFYNFVQFQISKSANKHRNLTNIEQSMNVLVFIAGKLKQLKYQQSIQQMHSFLKLIHHFKKIVSWQKFLDLALLLLTSNDQISQNFLQNLSQYYLHELVMQNYIHPKLLKIVLLLGCNKNIPKYQLSLIFQVLRKGIKYYIYEYQPFIQTDKTRYIYSSSLILLVQYILIFNGSRIGVDSIIELHQATSRLLSEAEEQQRFTLVSRLINLNLISCRFVNSLQIYSLLEDKCRNQNYFKGHDGFLLFKIVKLLIEYHPSIQLVTICLKSLLNLVMNEVNNKSVEQKNQYNQYKLNLEIIKPLIKFQSTILQQFQYFITNISLLHPQIYISTLQSLPVETNQQIQILLSASKQKQMYLQKSKVIIFSDQEIDQNQDQLVVEEIKGLKRPIENAVQLDQKEYERPKKRVMIQKNQRKKSMRKYDSSSSSNSNNSFDPK